MSNLTQWSKPRELTDRATSSRPALALNNNTLCMAWRGTNESRLFVSTSQDGGSTWSAQHALQDFRAHNGPALAAFDDRFVMVWREEGGNRMHTSTSRDGLTWSPSVKLENKATDESPGLAAIGRGPNALAVLCWKGVDSDNIFVSTSRDFTTWSDQRQLDDRQTDSGVSVTGTLVGSSFVMTWRGRDKDHLFVSKSGDGLNWTPQRKLEPKTSRAPAITHSDNLGVYYMAWIGSDTPSIRVAHSENGLDWSPETILNDRTAKGLALSPVNRTLYMAWRGTTSDNIWTSILTP